MRLVAFHQDAFDDYSDWAKTDRKLFERLRRLISETAKSPFDGIGKPEPLRHELKGCWSRRLTDEHRLVYKVTEPTSPACRLKAHATNSPARNMTASSTRRRTMIFVTAYPHED